MEEAVLMLALMRFNAVH